MLVQYLPGILLLVMISSAIAFLVARYVSSPRRAIIRSATLSTLLLESWAYMVMGGCDFGFLAILAVISTASAAVVVAIVRSFRRSRRIVM
jgi:Flp pilus assembly protein protease CpaA